MMSSDENDRNKIIPLHPIPNFTKCNASSQQAMCAVNRIKEQSSICKIVKLQAQLEHGDKLDKLSWQKANEVLMASLQRLEKVFTSQNRASNNIYSIQLKHLKDWLE